MNNIFRPKEKTYISPGNNLTPGEVLEAATDEMRAEAEMAGDNEAVNALSEQHANGGPLERSDEIEEPIKTVCADYQKDFESECGDLVRKGYKLDFSNCFSFSAPLGSQREWTAIFVKGECSA